MSGFFDLLISHIHRAQIKFTVTAVCIASINLNQVSLERASLYGWRACDECFGIGVFGPFDDVRCLANLDKLALIKYSDAIGRFRDNPHVMRDKHDGRATVFADAFE